MSVQNWGPASQLRVRLVACGHTVEAHVLSSQTATVVCPICAREHVSSGQRPGVRDWTPSQELGWDATQLINTRQLKPRKHASEPLPGLKELLAEASTGHIAWFDLQGQTLHQSGSSRSSASVFRNQDAGSFVVWRASPKGCSIAGGSIVLPRDSVLLLSGAGAHFRHVSFSGGGVVCAGPEFTGSFHHCAFDKSHLSVAHGATATLRSCAFTACPTAVSATGPSTHATLHACTVSQCPLGFVAEAGASISAVSCHLSHCTTAIAVNDDPSSASLLRCSIEGNLAKIWGSTGVAMHAGSLRVGRSTIGEVGFGLSVAGAAPHIEVRRSYILDCMNIGLFSGHARAVMRDVEADASDYATSLLLERSQSTQRSGLVLCSAENEKRGRMQLERCTMRGRRVAVVHVANRSAAAITLCRFEQAESAVSAAGKAARVSLIHCSADTTGFCTVVKRQAWLAIEGGSLTGDAGACSAEGGSLFVAGAALKGHGSSPFSGVVDASGGAVVRLEQATVRGGAAAVHEVDSSITSVETTVTHLRAVDMEPRRVDRTEPGPGHGVAYSGKGGEIVVMGGVVDRCDKGIAMFPGSEDGGTVLAGGVVFEGCQQAVAVMMFGSGEVVDCVMRGAVPPGGDDAGGNSHPEILKCAVMFDSAAVGVVRNCTFQNNRADVHFGTQDRAQLIGCTFLGTRTERPAVTLTSDTLVEDCRFEHVQCAISAQRLGRTADQTVRGCRFACGTASGVEVRKGVEMTLLDSSFTECLAAVCVQEGGSLTMRDCESLSSHGGVVVYEGAVKASLTRCTIRGSGGVRGVSVEAGNSTTPQTAIELDGCVFKDVSMGVFLSGAAVAASLRGCEFRSCGQALWAFAVPSVSVTDTVVERAYTGISVGLPALPKFACMVCKHAQMYMAVKEWVVDDGPSVRRGGVCLHADKLTRVSLTGVRLLDCTLAGLIVHPHGHVDATRVEAERCGSGIHAEYISEASQFRQCAVRACVQPVQGSLMQLPAYQGRQACTGEVTPATLVPGVSIEGSP